LRTKTKIGKSFFRRVLFRGLCGFEPHSQEVV
jgi:hypothetical protein